MTDRTPTPEAVVWEQLDEKIKHRAAEWVRPEVLGMTVKRSIRRFGRDTPIRGRAPRPAPNRYAQHAVDLMKAAL